MRKGDMVRVTWFDGEQVSGQLVDHTRDWKNVTIRTDLGGLMNGMVKTIEPEYAQNVYPEAKRDMAFSNGAPCGGA